MKTFVKLALLGGIAALIGVGAFSVASRLSPREGPAPQLYTCPMHPEYTSDRPGECPTCGMTLVPVKKDAGAVMSKIPDMAIVPLDLDRRQKIGLRLGVARKESLAKTVRAVGIVAYDERMLSAVSLKVAGWVEELNVRAVGDVVTKGDALMALYSPELLEAQQNHLLAKAAEDALSPQAPADARAAAAANVKTTRERLLLLDLTDAQIAELESRAAPSTRIVIHAKTSGVVTARSVVQGAYAEPGKSLLELADNSAVWVNADIYEQDMPFLKVGDAAAVTLSALPGRTFAARVAYIYPSMNQETRTLRIRLDLPNADGALKPGMYADIALAAPIGDCLVVDDGAVLDTGTRRIVFLDRGDGTIEPREVKVGPRAGGLTAIVEGLVEGDKIVTSGNFLIDAESRLKASFLKAGGKR